MEGYFFPLFRISEAAFGTLYPISGLRAHQQTAESSGMQLKWSRACTYGSWTVTKRINCFCLAWRRLRERSNCSLQLTKEWLERREKQIFLTGISSNSQKLQQEKFCFEIRKKNSNKERNAMLEQVAQRGCGNLSLEIFEPQLEKQAWAKYSLKLFMLRLCDLQRSLPTQIFWFKNPIVILWE